MITVTRGNPTDEEIAALVMALLAAQSAVVNAHARRSAWRASAGGYQQAPTAWGPAAREWKSWS